MQLESPVALFLFNRPDLTARTFEAVARARPRRLLLIADGPRNEIEHVRTEAARAAVAKVDWDCSVERQFSDFNMGCRRRVSSGLNWVFDRCPQAIILEDDCLPNESFFPFCHELLVRYADDPAVAMISGDNFQPARRGGHSYYFSAIAHVWGWATWRRAWRNFDESMTAWPKDRNAPWLAELLVDPEVLAVYQSAFDAVHAGRVDTWDAQWQLAVWRSGGLVALPSENLVSNLGFGAEATHTRLADSLDANLPTAPLAFPLSHPPRITRDVEADILTWRRSIHSRTISAG